MIDKSDMTVGERIMFLRNSQGYTREYLAKKTDISSKFLYEIEVGKRGFSATTLLKLADALEVSMEYIMTGHGERKCDSELLAKMNQLEKYKPNTLEAVQELLQIAYDILANEA